MNPDDVQHVHFVANCVFGSAVYLLVGVMGATFAIAYRKENNIKPMKGWRAVLITFLWPVWFAVFLSVVILVSIWNFLWSDVC